MTSETLFRNDRFQLDLYKGPDDGRVVVFFADETCLGRGAKSHPGIRFARTINLNIGVLYCSEADWYQDDSLYQVASAICALRSSFEQVVLTGWSMGAYGVLKVASVVAVDHAVVFSPMVCLDSEIMREHLPMGDEVVLAPIPRHLADRYSVIYDPISADHRQLSLIDLPDHKTQLGLVHGVGHNSLKALSDARALRGLRLALFEGATDVSERCRSLRGKLRETQDYAHSMMVLNAERRPKLTAKWMQASSQDAA